MAYQKTVWVDQNVENPRTYVMRDNGNGTTTLLDAFGAVTELGTPVNAANMNKIENGIADLETYLNTILNTIYPVGSIYIGTQSTCPMGALIPDSTWALVAKDKALWTGDGTNGNTTIAAGLPNITGTWKSYGMSVGGGTIEATGALTEIENNLPGSDGYGTNKGGIGLDASLSNAIYGASDTVQPPAYVVNVWRRTA